MSSASVLGPKDTLVTVWEGVKNDSAVHGAGLSRGNQEVWLWAFTPES